MSAEKPAFTQVGRERYEEMLDILPPAYWVDKGFLVGEPGRIGRASPLGTSDRRSLHSTDIGVRTTSAKSP